MISTDYLRTERQNQEMTFTSEGKSPFFYCKQVETKMGEKGKFTELPFMVK